MSLPFVLLQMRPEQDAREGELASVRRASGLGDRIVARSADREELAPDFADGLGGVVVGGSPYSVSDPDEAKSRGQRLAERQLAALAERALERGIPVFFTCFGIGVLTLVLGGVVDRTHPEPVSAAESRLTAAGRADPIAGALPDRFTALTGHKESAPEPPPGAVLLATNDASPVQLYRAASILASQFHPEPTTDDFIRRAGIYQRHGYFPPEEYEAIAADLRAATVTEPQRLLRRFAEVADRRDA
ncbi:glutamine amidotransferase-related protein [Amnibacterium kyonggiense]|uniref:GMP synthase (Glutamine-hydrolysing) n=1 Tax=Amnibacterium kyonggiense TaxID=595671 RepID=A0A4R7FL68_9MICO|nr:gamma-glutamyl-gamma-aminobutyrate hydrolase family protein [Amnibacterium kyonggiense]TDS77107.1 GMP synthase (glutamine-hydrolysing) [Amnibacterium kyonggiense]